MAPYQQSLGPDRREEAHTTAICHHRTFGRSGQIAPHESLSLSARLRGQSAVISSRHVKRFLVDDRSGTTAKSLDRFENSPYGG